MRYNSKKKIASAMIAAMAISAMGPSVGTEAAAKMSLNKTKVTLKEGKTTTLKVKNAAKKAKITWKSSKKTVATVSSKGKVTAKKKGTAKITATIKVKKSKKVLTCTVKVDKGKAPAETSTPIESAVASETPVASATASQEPGASTTPVVSTTPEVTVAPTPAGPTATPVVVDKSYAVKMGTPVDVASVVKPANGDISDYEVTSANEYISSVEDGKIVGNHIGKGTILLSLKSNPEVAELHKVSVDAEYAAPEGYSADNPNIKHGEVKEIEYETSYRPDGDGYAMVWLPPDYDESKQYNLLFCLHGGNDNYKYWTKAGEGANDGCRAQYVLDNLYAQNLMEDTIVIFPTGVIPYDANKEYPNIVESPYLSAFWKNHYLLEFEIVNELLPYAEKTFPVMKGPDHTGVCGLSMGCAQTMEIGFKHPDLFHYMGCFSAGSYESGERFLVKDAEAAAKLNEQLKLCFFITGENDHMQDDSMRNFVKDVSDKGLNNVFYEVPAVGHDDFCWDQALYAFMQHAFK